MGFWPIVIKVIRESDILLVVQDVRLPEISQNEALEKILRANGKLFVRVFTKIDLVSEKFLEHVKSNYKDAFFVSGTKNIGISELKIQLLIMAKRAKIENPRIGVVGYPNIGKSAIINALAKRARTRVASFAGTTRGQQWVKVGGLFVIDSPGVIPYEDNEVVLGVLGAKDPEKIRRVYRVALRIVKMFMEYDKKILEDAYEISISNTDNILEEIGRKRGMLLKGGIVDENRVSVMIIKDWQNGKIKL